MKCAVRWLRANADTYDVDTENIGAVGYSAGGHLALALAETAGVAELEGEFCEHDATSEVQAASSRSGPADLALLFDETTAAGRQMVHRLLDLEPTHTPAEDPEPYAYASPVTWLDADGPPVQLLQGLDDTLVPPLDAAAAAAAYAAAGRDVTHVEVEGNAHGWSGDADAHVDALEWSFLAETLRGEEREPPCSPWPSCG